MLSVTPVSFGTLSRRRFFAATAATTATAFVNQGKVKADDEDKRRLKLLDDNASSWANELEALKKLGVLTDTKKVLTQEDCAMGWKCAEHLAEVMAKLQWNFTDIAGYFNINNITKAPLETLAELCGKDKTLKLETLGELHKHWPKN